ncbi:MAG TPA: tyrosine-protein phosphatase [Gemmataceae bacterium]|nr:tyrosine-protein phosphatase [Gemmataceae bacterium]
MRAPDTHSRSLRSRLIRLGLVIALLAPVGYYAYGFLTGNVHEVIHGEVYRGAQPSAASLERLIHKYKIRTVLNVRGCCWPDNWYINEADVCQRLSVDLEDVCFSAVHLPSRDELRVLLDVLDRAERPIFIHCRQGADRTGLAAMAALLMTEGTSYDAARRQLGMRYGHAPIGRTTMLDRFMDIYAGWLTSTRQEHTPARFRHWALHEYNGGWCDAHFDKVQRRFAEARLGKTLEYDLVVRNTGSEPWQFHPLKTAGYHVTFKVIDAAQQVVYEGRAGMLEQSVQPGETIAMTMIVPALRSPGRYRLLVDMIEEGHCWFHQTGSEPWEEEIDVRE